MSRAIPVNLNVPGPFKPTHKYANSVAMVLDSCEWEDRITGDVEFGQYVQLWADLSVKNAYEMVSEFISDNYGDLNNYLESNRVLAQMIPWIDCKQMIDILVEGKTWLLSTDSQGFVTAQCYSTFDEAGDIFDDIDQSYMKWSKDFEPCGVCGRYGHRSKEHDEYTGPVIPEYEVS